MPKLKTKRTLAKKISISKTGKMMRSHQLRSGHLRAHKSKEALRRHRVPIQISHGEEKTIRRLLGKG